MMEGFLPSAEGRGSLLDEREVRKAAASLCLSVVGKLPPSELKF